MISRANIWFALLFLLTYAGTCVSADVAEEVDVPDCATFSKAKGVARATPNSTDLMIIANMLERQGEGDFHIKYDKPLQECRVENFQSGGIQIAAYRVPEVKGISALSYRFALARPEGPSTILFVRSGVLAVMKQGASSVHVSEERSGVISWYSMYKDVPSYEAARTLVEDIANGKQEALLSVRWLPGAKEGDVVHIGKKFK